ncbi:MAG: hypothetical protein V1807_01815 [Patescibacteria group bacterium]
MRQLLSFLITIVLISFYSVIVCAQDEAERPFQTAEKHHLNAEFEDARNWYRMIISDFPDSPLAAEAAVRAFNLDSTLYRWEAQQATAEVQAATEKLAEMGQYQSEEFQRRYFSEADAHMQQVRELSDRSENTARELVQDYDVLLERYLDSYHSELWTIPKIPTASEIENLTSEGTLEILSEQGLEPDISSYLFLSGAETQLKMYSDYEPFWLKLNYNARANEVSTDRKLDRDKLRFLVGTALFHSKNFHERGKRELEELIASIEDPYSEIKYDAEKLLKQTPLSQATEEGFQAWEELRRLIR